MTEKLSWGEAPGDRRNLVLLLGVTLLWAVCLTAANAVQERDLLPSGLPATLAALAPMLIGVLVIWSHVRYLQHTDELQRRINLYAMAVGFGVTVVFTLSYPLLERVGGPSYDGNEFVVVGVLAYAAAFVFWSRRYR